MTLPRLLNYSFTPNRLISLALASIPALIIVGYVVKGPTTYFDINTLVYGLIISLLIISFNENPWSNDNPLVKMVSVTFLLFIFSRLLTYLYFPETVKFPFDQEISLIDINEGLLYISVGTCSFVLGLTGASYVMSTSKFYITVTNKNVYQSDLIIWMAVLFLVAIFELYFTQWMGMTALNLKKFHEYSGQQFFQVLRAMFGVDTVLLACITYIGLVGNWQGSWREWIWVIVLSFISLLVFAINGSRGGPIRLLEFILPVLLLRSGSAKISSARLISFSATFLIIGALSFVLGDYYRTQNVNGLEAHLVEAFENEEGGYGQSKSSGMFNRLGAGLDYAIFVATHVPAIGSDCAEKFLNYPYILKSIANYLAPGNVFTDAEINTSRVFSICYRGMTFEHVLNFSGYHSEPWTMWGLALLMHGWWGGVIFLFACGAMLHTIYFLAEKLLPTKIAPYFIVMYVFLTPSLFIINFGLDHVVSTFIAVGFQLSVALMLFGVFVFLRRSVKNRRA